MAGIACCSKLDVVYGIMASDWMICDDVAGSMATDEVGIATAVGCFFSLVVTGGTSSLTLVRGLFRFSAKQKQNTEIILSNKKT